MPLKSYTNEQACNISTVTYAYNASSANLIALESITLDVTKLGCVAPLLPQII